MQAASTLRLIKVVHTLVWALFAGSILAIPVFAAQRKLAIAAALIAFVFLEVLVLLANRMRCPLTDIAARHTLARIFHEPQRLPSQTASLGLRC